MSTAHNGTNSIQYPFNYITYRSLTPRRNELEGAVIRMSVRRSVHVNVYGIIAKRPIQRHHHTSMYFRVFDNTYVISFSYVNCNNFIIIILLLVLCPYYYKKYM